MLSATDITNLETARSNFVAQLVALSAARKPSYNINGQNVNWEQYGVYLREQIRLIDDLLTANQDSFEEVSLGYN